MNLHWRWSSKQQEYLVSHKQTHLWGSGGWRSHYQASAARVCLFSKTDPLISESHPDPAHRSWNEFRLIATCPLKLDLVRRQSTSSLALIIQSLKPQVFIADYAAPSEEDIHYFMKVRCFWSARKGQKHPLDNQTHPTEQVQKRSDVSEWHIRIHLEPNIGEGFQDDLWQHQSRPLHFDQEAHP